MLNTLLRSVTLLAKNPKLLLLKIRDKLFRHKFPADPVGIMPIGSVQFPYDLHQYPFMTEIFQGKSSREVTELMRRHLKPWDVFLDVGANIGHLTAYALNLVGKNGQVHSFEPVPKYFSRLQMLQTLNPGYTFALNNVALGSATGTATIHVCKSDNIGWNTMVPEFMAANDVGEALSVQVICLSDYLHSRDIKIVNFIKIDTEGYEFLVIQGLQNFLESTPCRPWIVCEIAPTAYSRLGLDLTNFEHFMTKYNYKALTADTLEPIQLSSLVGTIDVLFAPSKAVRQPQR